MAGELRCQPCGDANTSHLRCFQQITKRIKAKLKSREGATYFRRGARSQLAIVLLPPVLGEKMTYLGLEPCFFCLVLVFALPLEERFNIAPWPRQGQRSVPEFILVGRRLVSLTASPLVCHLRNEWYFKSRGSRKDNQISIAIR